MTNSYNKLKSLSESINKIYEDLDFDDKELDIKGQDNEEQSEPIKGQDNEEQLEPIKGPSKEDDSIKTEELINSLAEKLSEKLLHNWDLSNKANSIKAEESSTNIRSNLIKDFKTYLQREFPLLHNVIEEGESSGLIELRRSVGVDDGDFNPVVNLDYSSVLVWVKDRNSFRDLMNTISNKYPRFLSTSYTENMDYEELNKITDSFIDAYGIPSRGFYSRYDIIDVSIVNLRDTEETLFNILASYNN